MLRKLQTDVSPFDVFEEEPRILERVCWVRPRLVAEIKFMNLSEDLKMRAPSFQRLRIDKKPKECVLEERDLKYLQV
jgi:bifunctional non-homologous end joining protein LigD